EFAGRDREPVVGGELDVIETLAVDAQRLRQLHVPGITEVDAKSRLRDQHRVLPIGREVHVVRIVDSDARPLLSRQRVYRSQAVGRGGGYPQSTQIVGRDRLSPQ